MTKERPILFSAPMVRAILEGRKTQTRRVIKKNLDKVPWNAAGMTHNGWAFVKETSQSIASYPCPCPYGAPGDRLWIRETFGILSGEYIYRAGPFQDGIVAVCGLLGGKFKPSIHMPRAASRITLEITKIRAERLQDISEDDARAEGIKTVREHCHVWPDSPYDKEKLCHSRPSTAFFEGWRIINGEQSFDNNPWVWVVEFKQVDNA